MKILKYVFGIGRLSKMAGTGQHGVKNVCHKIFGMDTLIQT